MDRPPTIFFLRSTLLACHSEAALDCRVLNLQLHFYGFCNASSCKYFQRGKEKRENQYNRLMCSGMSHPPRIQAKRTFSAAVERCPSLACLSGLSLGCLELFVKEKLWSNSMQPSGSDSNASRRRVSQRLSLISLSRSRSVEFHGSMSQSPVLNQTGIVPVLMVMIVVEVRPSVDT